ncbi:MAG: M48 family metalloprotease [Desulfovibrionaceae bacterium]|nr:M48 family metalloprotease [Desulfovibrionaceae bacterium]
MKNFLVALAGCCLLGLGAGCVQQISLAQVGSAVADLGIAATLNDAKLKDMARAMRVQGDAEARVAGADDAYTRRLAQIMARHTEVNGIPLNYKVYLTSEVNANASADGSVRVYSGLMDLMTDDEIRFVLGHEIGHVAHGDTMRAMRVAYIGSATRKGIGALSPTAQALSGSVLGDLLEATLNAQFSQSQESQADDYSMQFLKANGYNTQAAVTALRKLERLGGGGGGMLSSHPDSGKRAERMAQAIGTR